MRGQPYEFRDFHGGVNTTSAPYLVAPDQCRDCRNVSSSIRGAIRKRSGCQDFSTPPAEITSLYGVEATTTPYMVGVTSAGGLVKIDSVGTATSIKGALTITAGTRWEFCQAPAPALGPVFGVNRTDTPIAWTGAGNATTWTATSGTVPNGKFVITHANRVWVANVSGGESTLYFSAIGNARDWPVENVVQLDPNDGDQITGLGKVGSYLIVFKRRKTFAVYDTNTGANSRISDSVGTSSHRSIAESPYGTFFLSEDRGICQTDGSTVDAASRDIDATLHGITSSARVQAAGIFFNNHYYLSVAATSGVNDVTCDFDTNLRTYRATTYSPRLLGSWWFQSFVANQWTLWRSGNTEELYAANVGTAKVSKAFVSGVTQDNGANFTAYWKGPWLDFQAPFQRKRLRQMHIDGTGPVEVYVARDFNAGSDLAASALLSTASSTYGGAGTFGDTGLFGDASDTQEARIFTLGTARSWSAIFQTTTSTAMEIDSYTMAITPRKN